MKFKSDKQRKAVMSSFNNDKSSNDKFHDRMKKIKEHSVTEKDREEWKKESSKLERENNKLAKEYGYAKGSKQFNKENPSYYEYVKDKNNDVFYRGTTIEGEGNNFGAMGTGTYITWDKKVADSFALISSNEHKSKPITKSYKVSKDVKLIDWDSEEMWEIRKKMGVQNRWERIDDPVFANALSYEVKKKGYDGITSRNPYDGIVIFDKSKITEEK